MPNCGARVVHWLHFSARVARRFLPARRSESALSSLLSPRRDRSSKVVFLESNKRSHRGTTLALSPRSATRFPKSFLVADANGSYAFTCEEDRQALSKIDALGLTAIEQPLAASDLEDHARLTAELADSVVARRVDRLDGGSRSCDRSTRCRGISVKPARLGGILAARKVHDRCAERRDRARDRRPLRRLASAGRRRSRSPRSMASIYLAISDRAPAISRRHHVPARTRRRGASRADRSWTRSRAPPGRPRSSDRRDARLFRRP